MNLRIFGLGLALAACKGGDKGEETAAPLDAPVLAHTTPTGEISAGDLVDLSVTATDEDGVAAVVVYSRTEGDSAWDAATLSAGEDNTWTVSLGPLSDPGLEYYFKATDASGSAVTAYLPEDRDQSPFLLAVQVNALPLPWSEDFEPAEEEDSLYDEGWWVPSLGFPSSPWDLGEGGQDDTVCATHLRTVVDDGVADDWLISPPLDLSTLDAAMVLWAETGTNVAAADHGLYLSTGSRDPLEGGFVEVNAALPAPSDEGWADSAAYDLSAWAGQPVVYLAWRYQGAVADDWRIDDVQVRALAPVLSAALAWDPDPVHPGETATLTATLRNSVDAAGTGLVATLSLPDGGGTLAEDSVTVGEIPALGTSTADFSLTVDADLHDNQVLPVALSVTDGTDTWSFDLELVVGQRSTATLDLTLAEAAAVQIVVGVGDPDDPTASTTAYSGSLPLGSSTVEADITDFFELLPPAAGEHRWFARVQAGTTGVVDSFSLDYGGLRYEATVLPAVEADIPLTVWLPEPPEPVLLEVTTDPDPLEPGTTGVAVEIEVGNTGASSSGPVSAELMSADPDVALTGTTHFEVDTDLWATSETHTLSGITLDVSADHTDSSPLDLVLLLDDGTESWSLDVAVSVPWPVLAIQGVSIEDSGGDGILDPDETAELSFTLGNTGDESTFGPVDAVLSLGTGGTARATLGEVEDSMNSVAVGSSRDLDGFTLTVEGGSAGDTVELVLDMDDRTATYRSSVVLTLGESPWFSLGTDDDPTGDAVDDYPFDFVRGQYRVTDGVIQVWLTSDMAYDADTLFIESWAESAGADYTYYRVVLQSGVVKLQGYLSGEGFTTLAPAEVEYLSDTDLILSWNVADMGLLLDELSMGWSAGWCGPDTYTCDQYPDGWGYPYISFTTADWFALAW